MLARLVNPVLALYNSPARPVRHFPELREDRGGCPCRSPVDGYTELPTKPGLGIELEMDVVRAHPHQPVDMRLFG